MGRPWTAAEDAAIREHGRRRGPNWPGWADLLPDRSPAAIRNRKSTLGLTRGRAAGSADIDEAGGPGTGAGHVPAPSDIDEARPRAAAPWDEGQRLALVEAAVAVTAATGHTLGECAVELARLVREQRGEREIDG